MRNKRDPEWIRRLEDKLLCLATVPSLNEQSRQRMIELIGGGIDWTYVICMARSHEILPLLCNRLEWACPHLVPDLVLDQLRDHVRNEVKYQRSLMMELVRILKFLENHQLPAIPLLSPVLSGFIYQQPGLRSYSNLEILLPRREVLKGWELLQRLGYQTSIGNHLSQAVRCIDVQCKIRFRCRERNSYLKLCWDGNRHHLAFPFDLKAMATRLQSIEVMGKKIRILSTEDLILVLCERSTRRAWQALGSIADIAWLLANSRELNWDVMIERAKRYGSQRMLFLGLFLAQEVMKTELPDYVSRRIAGEKEVGYLAEIVCQQLFRKPDHLPHRLKKGFFYFRAKDSLQQKLRDGLRSLFVPTAEDCVFMSLPNRLFPLYYLIRPIHLSGRYVLGWLKGQEEEVGFLPSKQSIVAKMLDLAQIQPKDVVYDPGCGDGRIVIMAAKRYGVRAVGIDIDPERIAECRIHARRENVEQLVTFIQQDVMQVDLSEASVLMLYMPSDWNQLILPKILRELRHGARIVSNDTGLGTFTPDKTELVLDERVVPPHFLYLWYVHRPSSEKGGKPLARIGRGEPNSA